MRDNEHAIDRSVRILAGIALLGAALAGFGWGWAVPGALLLATGLAGRCPAYALLGVRTCGTGASPKEVASRD